MKECWGEQDGERERERRRGAKVTQERKKGWRVTRTKEVDTETQGKRKKVGK